MNVSNITGALHFTVLSVTQMQEQRRQPLIDATDVICLVGLILLGCWLLKTSFGKNALGDSMPRRNNMPFYMPFILLCIWFVPVSLAIWTAEKLMPDVPEWQSAFVKSLINCIGPIPAVAVIILLAWTCFAGRLKGFGLNIRTIHKDFFAAFINLLAVWPLILLAIIMTVRIGKLIWGADYEIQQHEGLELITSYPQLSLRVLFIATAVVVAPVLEELIFRGMFQTAIRSLLLNLGRSLSAWLAIVISSILFAMIHPDTAHWPALFVLSMCMGYAYEKSGSLFRAIFIHALFNGLTILSTLSEA